MKGTSLNLKKILTVFFLICFILTQNSVVFAVDTQNVSGAKNGSNIFEGKVEVNKDKEEQNNIFTGETQEVKEGTRLKMTVSSVISSGYNEEGDEFFAEVTNDLSVPGGVVIPSGTIAHGKVSKLEESKRLGRDAYIKVDFDYLVTPDGREIPVEASMTTKRNPVASAAKVVLEDTAYTVAGGIIGGFLALKFLGIGTAIASNGYTVAGGAGVGAIVGATRSVVRKGGEVLIAPGDEINVKIGASMALPVMTEEAFKDEEIFLEGLDVEITDYKIEKDPFGTPNTITLNLDIKNKTSKTFSSFDMALVNDYKSVYFASPFGNTDLWFKKITPNARMSGKLSFSVDNPKRKHWLVFYDSSTRKPLAKISVKNAERKLKKQKDKSKK